MIMRKLAFRWCLYLKWLTVYLLKGEAQWLKAHGPLNEWWFILSRYKLKLYSACVSQSNSVRVENYMRVSKGWHNKEKMYSPNSPVSYSISLRVSIPNYLPKNMNLQIFYAVCMEPKHKHKQNASDDCGLVKIAEHNKPFVIVILIWSKIAATKHARSQNVAIVTIWCQSSQFREWVMFRTHTIMII